MRRNQYLFHKSSDTEKYVYELKDNKYIETVFIKRRDGGTVCVPPGVCAKLPRAKPNSNKEVNFLMRCQFGVFEKYKNVCLCRAGRDQ